MPQICVLDFQEVSFVDSSGIAVVIFSTQIKDIFGLTITEKIPGDFIEKWACYFNYFHTINWAALALAVGTVAITLLSRRFWPRVPAMLVGMLLARVMERHARMETTLDVKLFTGEFHL